MAKSFVIILFTILFGLNHVSEKQYNHTNDRNQIIEMVLKNAINSTLVDTSKIDADIEERGILLELK